MKSHRPKISVVDYGVGNLRSITRAFEYCGADISITEDAEAVMKSDAIVLPGDGAFATGMNGLKVRNLKGAVLQFANSKKPILGICLGAQILMTVGFEFGQHKGLNLIPGKVVKFDEKVDEEIPQIGLNGIFLAQGKSFNGTILAGAKPGSNVYFIHSYVVVPKSAKNILSTTKYGNSEFCSVVYDGRIYGCQFHPEKSGAVGLKIIENFIKIAKRKF